jgi:hypothetical protein
MRPTTWITMAALALALSGAPSLALADDAPSFEEVDKNADGAISKTEAEAVAGLDFASADANDDGKLSREEYELAAG